MAGSDPVALGKRGVGLDTGGVVAVRPGRGWFLEKAMAIIRVNDENVWGTARWVQRYLLENFQSTEISSTLLSITSNNVNSNIYYIDLRSLIKEDISTFRTQAHYVYINLIKNGPESVFDPVFFESLKRHIKVLLNMLSIL